MNYSQYRGRGAGRILHALEVYVNKSIIVDHVQIGDGEITYASAEIVGNKFERKSRLFAKYEWEGEDTPNITFLLDVPYCQKAKEFAKYQYFKKPFLDDFVILTGSLTYCIQEVRNVISLQEALFFIWKRDKHNEANVQKELEDKIKESIQKSYHNHLTYEQVEKMWLHVAYCSVYDVFAPGE